MPDNFMKIIHRSNVEVHDLEASFYEFLHKEIYNEVEQKRTVKVLEKIDGKINRKDKIALDFGAGTGNITGKLLDLGYVVHAVDISGNMCKILRKKYVEKVKRNRLFVHNKPIEDFNEEIKFDLICCYSVLHHLPDYKSLFYRLDKFLKKGGIIYFDHETSPIYYGRNSVKEMICKYLYVISCHVLNRLYYLPHLFMYKIPNIDYSFSDYWVKNKLDYKGLKKMFVTLNYEFYRADYHNYRTRLRNPLYLLYEKTSKPDTCYWIGKKC